jgi:hypothetical protein
MTRQRVMGVSSRGVRPRRRLIGYMLAAISLSRLTVWIIERTVW